MIKIVRLKDIQADYINRLFNRYSVGLSSIIDTVIPIVNDVRQNGDDAVRRYCEKYDGVRLEKLSTTEEDIEKGYKNVSHEIIDAFIRAKNNIEEFHLHQKREDITYSRDDGTKLGIIYQPIERVAIYVPGGKASYPSTILMAAIPAMIAGAEDLVIITPPDKSGEIPDVILAVCRILGIRRIFKSGGAQGVAAAGFGTESIEKVDIIVGPGNKYVTAAKAYLFSLGVVQIDSIAGPSEIVIVADETANPVWIAFDLLSQAEHDEMAVPLLVTTSPDMADRVKEEIIKDIEKGEGRHEIKKKSVIGNGLILLADSIDEAIEFSNRFAPEHLELMISNPMNYLSRIRNVGSLFLGQYSPVAVGDYFSGTNHILPTGGASRFSSGLSVDTFLRRTTFQLLTESALAKAWQPISIMSRVEGFEDKHGGSLNIRFKKGSDVNC